MTEHKTGPLKQKDLKQKGQKQMDQELPRKASPQNKTESMETYQKELLPRKKTVQQVKKVPQMRQGRR
jgi:hypothetical protein